MKLGWFLTCYILAFDWCGGEDFFPSIPSLEVVNVASSVDQDPLSSLADRYPNSQIKGAYISSYGAPYAPPYTPQPPYPSNVPYYAAKEYGLPGFGYVPTITYYPTKYTPTVDTEQQYTGYSITPQTNEEASPEEEEEEETTEAPVPTTTTKRPTRPTLKPPPRPPLPPPPPPTPIHSTHAINKAPPKLSHRLPKLPPKPQTDSPRRKKPKMKLNKGWNEWAQPFSPYENTDYARREFITEEEDFPLDYYRQDVGDRGLLTSDPRYINQYFYEVSVPSYANTEVLKK